jgi:hypothetical protein
MSLSCSFSFLSIIDKIDKKARIFSCTGETRAAMPPATPAGGASRSGYAIMKV